MPARFYRLRHLLSNPVATVLLGAILAADIALTPRTMLGPSQHWYPFRPGLMRHPAPGTTNWDHQCFAVRSADGIRFTEGFLKRGNSPNNATLHLEADRYATGWWARTMTTSRYVVVADFGSEFNSAEQQLCRDHLIDRIDSERFELSDADVARLRREDYTISRPLYAGYLHNGLSLVSLLAFCYSWTWLPRTPAMFRNLLARSRLRRGVCPHCAYSRVGLAPAVACPECGETCAWPSDAP